VPFVEPPRGDVFDASWCDGDDHIEKTRPGMIEIVPGWARRTIGMRVVDGHEFLARGARLFLDPQIFFGSDEVAPSRIVAGGVRNGDRSRDCLLLSEERAATLVRPGIAGVPLDLLDHRVRKCQHRARKGADHDTGIADRGPGGHRFPRGQR